MEFFKEVANIFGLCVAFLTILYTYVYFLPLITKVYNKSKKFLAICATLSIMLLLCVYLNKEDNIKPSGSEVPTIQDKPITVWIGDDRAA